MTRINLVPPSELRREHLVAEYRELPRVFSLAREARYRGERPTDERFHQGFCLGRGHLLHFYPRLGFLAERHDALCMEMQDRGYTINLLHFWADYDDLFPNWFGDWEPSQVNIIESRHRILYRLSQRST